MPLHIPITESREISQAEYEISQVPPEENNVVAIVTVIADQTLGSKDITVNIPTGATITKVTALARINIINDTATAQVVDLILEVEGVAIFDQENVIGFPAVANSSGAYVIAEDASDEVTDDGQVVTLEAKATISAAAAVRFQVQYYLFITYKMG